MSARIAATSRPTEITPPRSAARSPSPRTPGLIDASTAYTVAEFRRRCGIGDYAWRQLRRHLPLRRVGKKVFILGEDWLDHLRQREPHQGADHQDER